MALPIANVGHPKLMTESGLIAVGQAKLLGFYINNISGATVILYDGGGVGGTNLGELTPAAGFHHFPMDVTDPYADITGTVSVTFFFTAGH